VDQLNLERVLLVSNEMLTRLIEFDVIKNIRDSFPTESASSGCWEDDVVPNIEKSQWNWIVMNISRVVQVKQSVSCARLRESDRSLHFRAVTFIRLHVRVFNVVASCA
jgi:hypothetical protein